MICDADSHFAPTEVYKNFDPDLTQRVFSHCHPLDVDPIWAEQYAKIKQPEWPACDSMDAFHQLPDAIKSKIRDTHQITGLYVSADLKEIYSNH